MMTNWEANGMPQKEGSGSSGKVSETRPLQPPVPPGHTAVEIIPGSGTRIGSHPRAHRSPGPQRPTLRKSHPLDSAGALSRRNVKERIPSVGSPGNTWSIAGQDGQGSLVQLVPSDVAWLGSMHSPA